MPYLKQKNHPSPMNHQTFTQPPTSNETAKPNENSCYSSPFDSSTSSSNSNSDQSQSSKSKKKETAELHSKNKDTSPMIKGMDVMDSEAAKYKFEREKISTNSERLIRFRQIQISRGMDPTHAVPSANRSDSGSRYSSSISSGSSSSLSAVGTDTSNKTPVATIVDGDDGDQCDFVDNGRNEGNNSDEGNEDDDNDKNGDGCNDITEDEILVCAAGNQCKAPSGANLADSPHSCWGCNKKIHSSVLCGDFILNLLSNNPSFIGMSLNNGCIIQQDDNN